MPTIQRTVAAGDDDAHEADDGSTFNRISSLIQCDSNSSAISRRNGGLRFTNITIPPGSTIISATCTVEIVSTGEDDDHPHVDIHCEAVDSADDFLTTSDVTSRERTAASTAWDGTDIGLGPAISPNFSTALQEVIDRSGWVDGNPVVVLLDGKTTPDELFRFESFDSGDQNPAILDVQYTDPPTVETPAVHGANVQRLPDKVAGY